MSKYDAQYEAWKKKKAEEAQAASSAKREQNEKRYQEWKAKNSGATSNHSGIIQKRVSNWITSNNNYVTNYKNRFMNRTGTYKDAYADNAEGWLTGTQRHKTQLDQDAEDILSMLDTYGSGLDADWVKSVRETMSRAQRTQSDILDAFTADRDYWAQFESKDVYTDWQRYQELQDTEAMASKVGELEPLTAKRWEEAQAAEKAYRDAAAKLQTPDRRLTDQEYAAAEAELDKLFNTMHEANAQYNRAKADLDYYSYYYGEDKERDELEALPEGYDAELAAKGLEAYTAEQARKQEEDAENAALELIGASFAMHSDESPFAAALRSMRQVHQEGDALEKQPTEKWTDAQRNKFGYLYQQNPTAAAEYAIKINDAIAKEEQEGVISGIYANAPSDFVGILGHSVPAVVAGSFGIVDFIDNVVEYGAKGRISQKSGVTPFEYSQAVTSGISQKLNEKYGTLDEGLFAIGGKGLGDLYSLGVSAAQSMVSAHTLGGTGSMVQFFGSAAASGVDDAMKRGATDEQALIYGTLMGAAEAYAEKCGIDNLLSLSPGETVQQIITNILKQGAQEGLEEGLTSVLGGVADNLVLGDNSSFNALVRQYRLEGMSAEDAQRQAWKDTAGDVIFDAIGGAITGTTSGGVQTGIVTVVQNSQDTKTGKKITQTEGGLEALKALALEMAGRESGETKNTLMELAEQMAGDASSRKTARTAGKLLRTVETTANARNASKIAWSLRDNGVSSKQASEIAEAVAASIAGYELTEKQTRLLDSVASDEKITSAIENALGSGRAGIAQRTRMLNNFYQSIAQSKQSGNTSATRQAQAQAENAVTGDNVTATEKTAPEGGYEVSAEGQAIRKDDGSGVNVLDFADAQQGQVTFHTSAGTVKAEDVNLSSETKMAVEMIVRMGASTEDANIMFGAFKSGDAIQKAKALSNAYGHGKGGGTLASLKHSGLANVLTDEQMKTAHEAGRKAAEKMAADHTSAQDTQRTRKPWRKGSVKGYGVTPKDLNEAFQLNETQRSAYKILTKIAEVTGVDIVLYKSEIGTDGKFHAGVIDGIDMEGKSGAFNWANNKIYIDVNAGLETSLDMTDLTKYTMLRTFGHEFTHFLEKYNAVDYVHFRELVFQTMERNGENPDEMVRALLSENPGWDYDRASREAVAEAMVDIVEDSHFTEELAGRHKGLLQTFVDQLKDFLNEIKRHFNALLKSKDVGSGLKEQIGDGIHYLEEIVNAFDKMAVRAVERYQETERDVATNGDGVQYQTKPQEVQVNKTITAAMSDSERTRILRTKQLVAPIYEGQADLLIDGEKPNLESGQDKLIKAALVRIGEEFEVFTDYDINDVNVKITLSRGNLRESVSKRATPLQIAKLLPVLKNAVEKSVGVESHKNRYFYDNTTISFDNLLGGYVDGEYFVPVRFGLKHIRGGEVTLYVVIDQKKIKAEVLKPITQTSGSTGSRSAYNINIAQIVPFVNSKDLLRYLPDDMLTSNQKVAKWEGIAETIIYTNNKNDEKYKKFIDAGNMQAAKMMVDAAAKSAGYTIKAYHGTTNREKKSRWNPNTRTWDTEYQRITVFKRQYPEQVGHFFNSDIGNAGGYGNEVYSVYLMLRKPLVIDCKGQNYASITHDGMEMDTYEWAAYAKKHRYDGVIFENISDGVGYDDLSRLTTDYVVFDSNRIKSADTITYDDEDNIIPISERFKVTERDIRYQRRTSTLTSRDVLDQAERAAGDKLNAAQKDALSIFQRQYGKLKELDKKLLAERAALARHEKAGDWDEAIRSRNRIATLKGMIEREAGKLRELESKDILKGIVKTAQPVIEEERLAKWKKQYGIIPEGENPVRDDSLPVSTDGKNRVSRTARTVKGAAATTNEFADLIDAEVTNGGLTYIPITNDAVSRKARERIERLGWDDAKAAWSADIRNGKTGAEMAAMGAMLLNNAAQAGDKKAWLDILYGYQMLGTNTAQGLQALRILKKLKPEDKLYMVKRSVRQMVDDMHLGTDIQVDENLQKQYREAETEKERDAVLGKIAQNVADQIPSTALDKWTALRYVNMLGNLRTQVRNVVGNLGMSAVVEMKNTMAAGLEAMAAMMTGGRYSRTKSVFINKNLLEAARKDFNTVKALILDGGKYSDSKAGSLAFVKQVQEKRRIFSSGSKALDKVLSPVERYRVLTNEAMEKGDLIFSKAAYARALAGYLQAKGVRGADLSAVDAALLDEARVYAVREAQEATFRDTNTLSKWVSQAGRGRGTPKAVRVISEGIMPFRKTPANILVRAVEYSPMGVADSVVKSIQAMQEGSQVSGADVINSWAKTLTGTGLFGLGMLLANLGLLVGGPDDDEDQEYFDQMNGWQNYAIVLPDGTNFTIDFLSPAAMPMFMGAQLMTLMQEGGIEAKDLESALLSIADPMIQMSMLQGLNDTLENIQYAESNFGQFLINAMLSYTMQGMTNTWLGQLERTFEGGRTTTYTDPDSAIPAWLQRAVGKASAKIPGWDHNQISYINAWGEEEANPAWYLNAVYNMLSPSYIDKGQEDAVSTELTRLNGVQSDVNVLPSTPGKTLTYTDAGGVLHEDYNLSAEEYVALATKQGQTQRQIVEDVTALELYKELPDGYKAKVIGLAYDYAREYAQIDVLDRDGFSSDWMAEIGEDAATDIVQHVIKENIKGMYLAGDISSDEAVRRRVTYWGDTRSEAEEKVAYWRFQAEKPEYGSVSESVVGDYYEIAKPAGIGLDTYYRFREEAAKCTGKQDAEGKTISGSVKAEKLELIDALPLTRKQKDALYLAEGWAESKLYQAPWH